MASPYNNEYLDDLTDMSDPPLEFDLETSEIVKFFTGRTVLVTGGSGFMGKLLVEKLLRSCPNIGKLFMFMRAKKGKTPEERFKEHFEDTVYDRLKREQPKFAKKVVMVHGDTAQLDLGLSKEDQEMLLRDTEIIFHGAATVRFDESVRVAANINVRGTKQLLLFAREMPNLKAFVHISTAFSHCVLKNIDEKFYTPPIKTDKLLSLIDILDDDKLARIQSTLIDKWPNTYAYTKAVAEDTVRQYSTGIPTCIVRPSIVIATAKEPVAGWINNLYGPTGVVVGAGIGLLRTLHCKEENIADIIPADYVIANIIAAAWDTATNLKVTPSIKNVEVEAVESSKVTESKEDNALNKNTEKEDELPGTDVIPIYNSVSSCQKPITWGEFMKLNEVYGVETPSTQVLWYYMFRLNRYLFVHNLSVLFFHLLPAVIVDALAYLTGRPPMLLSAYRKIHKFSGVISYFSTQQWRFHNDAVMKLWDKLGAADRAIFEFHLASLSWPEYFFHHIRGLRVYLVKDPLDTIDIGRAKYRKLKIAHYSLITLACLFIAWLILWIALFLWSLTPFA